ncbi:putative transposon Ty3-I Gag-Pol polyprotein [Trichinella spiralis]|uniref:putative transposon Ty3-I Gag-Pol polyprotein n=1 Tax=Trichinella spiralis TaxID=6334 RepID=UPI0001EFE961|nr:putative transposon Ty3-I Gag-Pol polyprotein [Trichinella spiralis]
MQEDQPTGADDASLAASQGTILHFLITDNQVPILTVVLRALFVHVFLAVTTVREKQFFSTNSTKNAQAESLCKRLRARRLINQSQSSGGCLKGKKSLVVDCSVTINRFILLDAYPLPKIDSLLQRIAKYRVFSTIDLKSAYHQIPILNEEKLYTACEADGSLYQFTRIPFGVTNAKKWNFTFNTAKCSFLTSNLRILGHEIENGEIRPGP